MGSKVLVILSSGKEARQKFSAGLMLAYFSATTKLYDDLKVVFHGPSEELLPELDREDSERLSFLLREGYVDSACIAIARNAGLSDALSSMGIKLMPSKDVIARYINAGYTVLVF